MESAGGSLGFEVVDLEDSGLAICLVEKQFGILVFFGIKHRELFFVLKFYVLCCACGVCEMMTCADCSGVAIGWPGCSRTNCGRLRFCCCSCCHKKRGERENSALANIASAKLPFLSDHSRLALQGRSGWAVTGGVG